MKKLLFLLSIIIFVNSISVKAQLFDNGDGTITDTQTGLMWLKNANLSGTTMNWGDANDWADNLDFAGYDDWRLPSGLNDDGTVCNSRPYGGNCTQTEFWTLWAGYRINIYDSGPFEYISGRNYWTSTEWPQNTANAMAQDLEDWGQNDFPKSNAYYAWAVRGPVTVIPKESIYFPPHRGVPGSSGPPVIDGKVQEDVGWTGANRITYGNGTNEPHMACQTLKDNSEKFIYLSFEIRSDLTFDDNDIIVICFRPDIANGLSSNDRKIVLYPICNDIGACNSPPQDNQSPRQITFYKNSASWTQIAQPTDFDVKVSSRNGDSKEWDVELKVPTNTTTGGAQWINFSDKFLFYCNVLRVSSLDNTTSQFHWPRNSPEVNGDINVYPFSPSEWGEADKSNTAVCKGVSLSNYSDIGTNNAPQSKILFDPPTVPPTPNTYKNTFYANVKNNSEVGGVPQQADRVLVRFRMANWGIPGPNDWADIPAVTPICPNVSSNPTCPQDIPAGTPSTPGTSIFNFEWTVPDAEIPNYQEHSHQCILVELNSLSNTNISTKSFFRNMDFVSASSFTRSAEISARGYGEPPTGFTDQKFVLQVTTKEYVYGGSNKLETLAIENLLKEKQLDKDEPLSVLNYVTHGYRYLGRFVVINGTRYAIIEPVGSFGYVVSHKGLVKEWKHKITGCEMIQPNLYKLDIPPEEKAIIVTQIEPVDYIKKWSLSLHAGVAIPTGTFANNYDPGYNILVDADYHFTNKWSIVALFGYNNFKSKTAGIDDTYIINVSANIRYEQLLGGPWSIYLGGGPGLYIPENGDSKLGANGGFGFNYDYNGSIIFELGGDYNTVFGNDTKFMHSHIGIIYRF